MALSNSNLRIVVCNICWLIINERLDQGTLTEGEDPVQWEAINRKQITRWQHVSQWKASSFGSL